MSKITMAVLDPNGTPLDNSLDHLFQDGVAVAKSIGVTLDLQVVNPALTKTPTGSGGVKNVDTAVIGGLRAFVRF